MCTPNANERKNIVRKDMKMNKLRLTNVIENHFYLDFNWKDRCAASYVSRRVSGPKTRFPCHDTDRIGKWSVSWQAGLRRLHSAATPFARVRAPDRL